MDYEKKGQVAGNIGNIIGLIVGVGVSVLVLIFVGTLGGQTFNLVEDDIDALATTAVTNESITMLNSTAVAATNAPIHVGTITILNSSADVGLGNFTIDYNAATFTLLNNAYNNTALDVSYTYGNRTIANHIKDAAIAGFEGLEQTGDYLPIIVMAFVIAFVLIIVLTNMGGFSGGKDNTAL